MVDYNRTVWKDHIKDQNGNVIQQGIPVSAKNLNNIENQLVILSAKENTLAELIRETIPSGFTTLSDLDYSYMATNPNSIKLIADSIAFVNGYKVVIPAGTIIQLDVPPTSGSRDDLIFLECWKQQDANGSVSWNYRIRVVDGVDFNKYPEGLKHYGQSWDTAITVQGALPSPIATPTFYNTFCDYKENGIPSDIGLFKNVSTSAGVSIDGYVYAIPMFRVHRRNSGGYSVNNGNGSGSFVMCISLTSDCLMGSNVMSLSTVSGISVGDYIYNINSQYLNERRFKVLAVDLVNKKVTLDRASSITMSANNSVYICHGEPAPYFNALSRAVPAFADIVIDRDIIDLRHQVSLTGFNYQQLLEDNFDKLLRGELQTNAKTQMLKTYHGVPKTPIDSNHVFYASFDGTAIAEIGGATNVSDGFYPMPTGLGANISNLNASVSIPKIDITIDMFVFIDLKNDANTPHELIALKSASNNMLARIMWDTSNRLSVYVGNDIALYSRSNSLFAGKLQHIRVTITQTSIGMYVNGKKLENYYLNVGTTFHGITDNIAKIVNTDNAYLGTSAYISDFSISNIDRGSTFATLPQDYIDGYARIDKAFNEQRNVLSDALISEVDFVQVKCSGANGKSISLGDSTDWAKDDGTKWNNGDRVKIKGLGGEIISGVIDSDTALGTLVRPSIGSGTTGIQLYMDSVAKFSVSDTFKITDYTNYTSAKICTITAIDSVNNILTVSVDSAVTEGMWLSGFYCIETTASTSSPKVQYFNGSALVDVTGTWSGLGTNEATFTLGTNASLTNQDLCITYGLNEIPGQGGISEVLTSLLLGESNGKRLAVNPPVYARDDFAGKINGSMNINPNIAKQNSSASMLTPSNGWNEFSQNQYGYINSQDSITASITTSGNGQIPQSLFSFNLIRILEDKFGALPCGSDIVSKVAWLKANISKISCTWWGYGSCPSGNKAYWTPYVNNAWQTDTAKNASNAITGTGYTLHVSYSAGYRPSEAIDSNGFIHFLAYTDASDGTTASSVNTDYVNIEITLNISGNYDILAPENPRRDDGKSNILLVRKETKEIQTMFNRGNNDGIVTYGDYIPAQLLPYNTTSILFEPSYLIGTTAGTGSRGIMDSFNQYCNKSVFGQFIGVPNMYNFKNETIFDTNIAKIFSNGNKQNNFSFSKAIGWGIDKYSLILNTAIKNQVINLLVLEIALINYNNELYIAVIGNTRIINADGSTSPSILNGNSNTTNVPVGLIKLNRRPLIK
ncbi:hypothetical protein [Clostridium beijerinckii]|uniref:hypothetical protein n=1 Tax=Clostridium beijerinckii TaxID=1520 RepID=UPI0003D2E854|nr:hypothetical protein [Clostridium beijerinckii]ALB46203.1 hypothetical protein X276_13625 [Clostridium beijerinckii NRRL B-598]